MGRRQLLRDLHQLGPDDLQALFFEAADDPTHQAPLEGIGLEDDEGGFHGGAPGNGPACAGGSNK